MLNVLEIILLDIKYLTINVVINQFDHIQMVNDQLMLTSIILFFFFFLVPCLDVDCTASATRWCYLVSEASCS